MTFSEISAALQLSIRTGQIHKIVHKSLAQDAVLTAKTRAWAEEWLYTFPKQSSNPEISHLDSIRSEIDEYVRQFVQSQYTGTIPAGCESAIDYLMHCECRSEFDTEEEWQASFDIYSAIQNLQYASDAINHIFSENWK